jgi:hypothetical protein
MDIGIALAIISVLIAFPAALYARHAANEARRSNDIGRLNSLFSLRIHYLHLMDNQEKMAEILCRSESGMMRVQDVYADLDSKLREVSAEIKKYHGKVVSNEI